MSAMRSVRVPSAALTTILLLALSIFAMLVFLAARG
jgi:hypothetical protein